MALRDHSLDDKITAAARSEFLEKGFAGASLRRIAENAGVTVGAIQIRYRSKDALFQSLLQPFLDDIAATFQSVRADYYSGAAGDMLSQLKVSMQHESAAILHLIFTHYEEAVLLLYRSAGSALAPYYDALVKSKIEESAAFFRAAGYTGVDETLLALLISAQFDSYRRIVAECPDRQTAEMYMSSLMTYHYGGWAALFDETEQTQEAQT